MVFSMGWSIVLAFATAAALVTFGVQNRRSGWKRERSDDVLDVMMLWAEAQALKHALGGAQEQVIVTPAAAAAATAATPVNAMPVAPSAFSVDLGALHMAVGPATTPTVVPEQVVSTSAAAGSTGERSVAATRR